jgi:peptidyl-prolyl cis-trans isomerase A (cyclophilin A)
VKSTAEIQVSKNNSIDKKVDSTQIKIDQIAQRLITNSNVVKKLTEFGDTNTEKTIVIYTKFGNMKFQLYSNTPLHRSNFVMLSKLKFYDNTLFYRIIDNFMIQGGNSDNEQMGIKFSSIGRYRIPNEIKQSNIHKKGAIAMAVATEEQNFGKKSSAINFYIVEGRKMSSLYFLQKEKEGVKFTDKQKEVYKNIGGAPHLDGDYTVFGEMISGFTTLDKLSKIKVDKYSWPKKDVFIDSIRAF